jgi:hypothetical protein
VLCCAVLRCAVLCCAALCCAALYCAALALRCTALRCAVLRCAVLRCAAKGITGEATGRAGEAERLLRLRVAMVLYPRSPMQCPHAMPHLAGYRAPRTSKVD